MAATALVVLVPEAEPWVEDLRDRFDPSSKVGVPAHITVLVPFMPPGEVDASVRERIATALEAVPRFDFWLDQVGRFPQTAYLAVDPAGPFVALTQALAQAFPDYPAYGGAHDDIVPHLTVADRDAQASAQVEEELRHRLKAHGPVHARCRAVTLLENSSGWWEVMETFALRRA